MSKSKVSYILIMRSILNFTNSVSNIQTLISSIDFNNQLNHIKKIRREKTNLINQII